MQSTVSVVIPTFNRSRTLRDAIQSAREQSYAPVEIVVVDDGSTDDTGELLAGYGSDITAVRQDNVGVSAARNAGVKASTGSIIMFVDSDDTLLPTAVAEQVSTLGAAGLGAPCSMGDVILRSPEGTDVSLFADRRLRPPHRKGYWSNVQAVITTRFLFTNQGLAIRRSAFERVGGFDQDLWVMEDFDLALRLAAIGPWAYTTAVVAVRNEGSADGLTSAASADQARLAAAITAICLKADADGTVTEPGPNAALDRMCRRAARAERRASSTARRFDRLADFLDEEVGERMRRNLPWYPRIEGDAL